MKRSYIKRIGKKTKAWNNARAKLKNDFERMGIMECEIQFHDCWVNNALGFAHLVKRRNVEDLREVVLACNPCHMVVESWKEAEMKEFLLNIIDERKRNTKRDN